MYTQLLAISRFFKQNPRELTFSESCGCTTKGDPVLSLISRELVLLGNLTHDAVFNNHCKALQGDGCLMMLAWLLTACQSWESSLHFKATELPFWPWTTTEVGIQLVCELSMHHWIFRRPPRPLQCPLPPHPLRLSQCRPPEDMLSTQSLHWRLPTAAPLELWLPLARLLGPQGPAVNADRPRSRAVPKEKVEKQPAKVLLEFCVTEAKHSRSHLTYKLREGQSLPCSHQACVEEPPSCHSQPWAWLLEDGYGPSLRGLGREAGF
ncbi:hypothetical protein P7K49_031758 [Saguinus oedipus]|uniref:Uncharacterized protein n=1 Tax=Saguinus oedipus TaxID=9490 RepID=A0ABQ9U281_SAGOE|nr:hypothetical protein P7K49_031758 [Saguinus oedipus]